MRSAATAGARCWNAGRRPRATRDRTLPPAERFFARHGGKTVFFGRFVALLRITAAWLAGISHMPWWRFFAWNAAGGIVWATGHRPARLLRRQGGSRRDQPVRALSRWSFSPCSARVAASRRTAALAAPEPPRERLERRPDLELRARARDHLVGELAWSRRRRRDRPSARPVATASSADSRIARPADAPASRLREQRARRRGSSPSGSRRSCPRATAPCRARPPPSAPSARDRRPRRRPASTPSRRSSRRAAGRGRRGCRRRGSGPGSRAARRSTRPGARTSRRSAAARSGTSGYRAAAASISSFSIPS